MLIFILCNKYALQVEVYKNVNKTAIEMCKFSSLITRLKSANIHAFPSDYVIYILNFCGQHHISIQNKQQKTNYFYTDDCLRKGS